jgi:hypothetical protein
MQSTDDNAFSLETNYEGMSQLSIENSSDFERVMRAVEEDGLNLQ